MKNDRPAFIREGGEISGCQGKNHYLVFYEASNTWYIQNDEWFSEGRAGGYLRIKTTGKYVNYIMSCFATF